MPGPIVFHPVVSGLPLSGSDLNSNWGLVESSLLDVAPYVISGLTVTAGSGLSVNVAAGVAVVGAEISPLAFVIGSLTPSTTNHLWLLRTGAGMSNTTGTPPAASVKLGTCVTSGSAVTSVSMGRTSGRQQVVQPQNLILGGPAAGTTSAGHPDALNLANWNATDAEGKSCYNTLPAGALPATFTAPVTFTYTDASTGSTPTVLTLTHRSSMVPAVGFGEALLFQLDNTSNVAVNAAYFLPIWGTPTAGGEGCIFKLFTRSAGADVERLRIKETGATHIIGQVGANISAATVLSANLQVAAGAAAAGSGPVKLTSGTLLTTPEAGVIEFLTPTVSVTPVTTRRSMTLASNPITADVTVANTTTETTLFTGTVAANEMAVGKVLRGRLYGLMSALITDTVTLRFKMGGTTFLTVVSTAAAITGQEWSAEFVVTCRTTGASGTVISQVITIINGLLQDTTDTGTHTVDTGAAENLTVTAQWSAASASDTITLQQGYLETLN